MTSEGLQRRRIASREVLDLFEMADDSLEGWMDRYQTLVVEGVRSEEVAGKIGLHLGRFRSFFLAAYGHDRISTVGRRDVADWQRALAEGLAPSTVNGHLASLSGFCTWVVAHAPDVFPLGHPTAGVPALPLPPLEPRTLNASRVRSLKNLCDRLERFALHKGRRRRSGAGPARTHSHARPLRDRAIVYVMLSSGLRRAELEDGVTLTAAARSAGVSLRTAQRWLSLYRQGGLVGLAPKRRSDRGTRRFPAGVVDLVGGLALRRPEPSTAWIHRQVVEAGHPQGWAVPSYSTVRSIVCGVDPALRTLAQQGDRGSATTVGSSSPAGERGQLRCSRSPPSGRRCGSDAGS